MNSNSQTKMKSKKIYITNTLENNKKYNNLKQNKNTKNKNNNIEYIYYNEYELNSLSYKQAIKYDKRTFIQYYFSLLKINNLLLFSFCPNNDYNSPIIKISLFLICFSLYFTMNTFFFTDSTMHKIYEDEGLLDIVYQIPQILYSSFISGVIKYLLKLLSLSQINIIQIKNEKAITESSVKYLKVVKCLKIKFIIFYILSFILLSFFWYYISCFCAVYKNTQLYLIEDTLISFFLSLLYPFCICLLAAVLRIYALNSKKKECIYKISKLLQLF